MAKIDVWMPLYIGDYLADTTRLTTEQHGAYFLLIMDYWRNGPPPDDDAILAGICRALPNAWKKLRPAIVPLFRVSAGQWHHKRIDEEIAKAAKGKEKAVGKASAAAEARWAKEAAKHQELDASGNATSTTPSNTLSNASGSGTSMQQAMLEQCPSPSPSEKPKKTRAEATATRLPKDWQPGIAEVEFCKAERPDLNPLEVADRFRDYWLGVAGIKGRKLDWLATWRNWVRNERKNVKAMAVTQSRHSGFENTNYHEGVQDGKLI